MIVFVMMLALYSVGLLWLGHQWGYGSRGEDERNFQALKTVTEAEMAQED